MMKKDGRQTRKTSLPNRSSSSRFHVPPSFAAVNAEGQEDEVSSLGLQKTRQGKAIPGFL
ncbi:hypothetical protein APS_1217 [Acetobacter pasteurianus subsp. pasteurianus LMG 1262 = NBRC 106471]|nr:hypothetical protein APS_1217 [Acetobacter pasteurianus subsp. pasteurianus LMG 1262 = NBRC 106471]